jgi:L-iditol 2-dehydrogenase
MKAVYLAGLRQFETRQVAEPKIVNDSDVLVRIKAVGVCGSDIHYYTTGRIGSQIVQFPFIIGHEAGGVVEGTGKGVTRVKAGRKIAIDPAVSCGQCDQCRAGRVNTCRRLRFMGAPKQLDGCMRELVVIHENCCYPLNENLTFEHAALSEPLAIAVYAVERALGSGRANVAILGAGPVGMCVFHVLRTKDAGEVFVTDKIEERLQYALQLDPAWSGNPDRANIVREISNREPLLLDVVFECSGDPAAIGQAIELLKPGGTLALIGITDPDVVALPIHELRRKEITIINIRRQAHCTQKAIDLLAQRQVKMDSMVTHRYPLEESQRAFDAVANYRDGVMKAMIFLD